MAAAVLLCACSGSGGVDAAQAPAAPAAVPASRPPDPAPPPPAPAQASEGATVGGDGSPIALSPLSPAEIEAARLPGELGCSFQASAGGPLLVAMGNVASREPALGVVKVGSYVERVAAPGGFDAMLKGATFSGAGKTVRIDLTGPAIGGGESPPRPATLTYDRADGARRTFPGRWSCGP